ncbi:MAG: rhomboid family intramembrane serine protease [Pseudobdellovibrio sp.]
MKRVLGLVGMVLGFAWTIGMIAAVSAKPNITTFVLLAAGVAVTVFSFILFRKAKPLAPTEAQLAHARELQEFNKNFPPHHYYTSVVMSVVLLAVYAVLVVTKNISIEPTTLELYKVGGGFGEDAAHGQMWRLFTQIFLHGSIVHLLSNIVGLVAAGRLLDYLAGRKNLVGVFLVGGLFASVASSVLHPTTVSIGASGAVFALYGAIFSSYFFNPKMKSLKVPNGIWVASAYQAFNSISYGFQHAGIDNAAHVGGLFAGFALMSFVYKFSSEEHDKSQMIFGGATAVVAAFALAVMPGVVKQEHSNPVAFEEKTEALTVAVDKVEKAEAEMQERLQSNAAVNEVEEMNWATKEFLPKYQKAINELVSISDEGLPEGLVSLKKSVQNSAGACRDMYQDAFELNRRPAADSTKKSDDLKEACVAKMKERYDLVDQLTGAKK